jgi:hypothetical protein
MLCEASSMQSSTFRILAVRGGICRAIFRAFQTVFYHFRQFCRKGTGVLLLRAMHEAERCRVGRNPHPSVAIVDAQSVKTVEESAHISGSDGHKRVKGRKGHLLVDTLGITNPASARTVRPLSAIVVDSVHAASGRRPTQTRRNSGGCMSRGMRSGLGASPGATARTTDHARSETRG